MIRLTGPLLLSLLCLMPLGAEALKKNEKGICPAGTVPCDCGGGCAAKKSDCPSCDHKILSLKQQKNTIYSLEEGAVVTCEDGKTLIPIPGSTNHWTCGTPAGTPGKK